MEMERCCIRSERPVWRRCGRKRLRSFTTIRWGKRMDGWMDGYIMQVMMMEYDGYDHMEIIDDVPALCLLAVFFGLGGGNLPAKRCGICKRYHVLLSVCGFTAYGSERSINQSINR